MKKEIAWIVCIIIIIGVSIAWIMLARNELSSKKTSENYSYISHSRRGKPDFNRTSKHDYVKNDYGTREEINWRKMPPGKLSRQILTEDLLLDQTFKDFYDLRDEEVYKVRELLLKTQSDLKDAEISRFQSKNIKGVPLIFIPVDPQAADRKNSFMRQLSDIISEEKASHFLLNFQNTLAVSNGNFGSMARMIRVIKLKNDEESSEPRWRAEVLTSPEIANVGSIEELEDFTYVKERHPDVIYYSTEFRVVPSFLNHLIEDLPKSH